MVDTLASGNKIRILISFPFSGQIKPVQVYLYWPNIGLMVKLYWNYLVERVQLVFNSILIFFA